MTFALSMIALPLWVQAILALRASRTRLGHPIRTFRANKAKRHVVKRDTVTSMP